MAAMEPRIQYAKTADGVSIAFWTLGEGMPFVLAPHVGVNHIQLEWQWPEYRASSNGWRRKEARGVRPERIRAL